MILTLSYAPQGEASFLLLPSELRQLSFEDENLKESFQQRFPTERSIPEIDNKIRPRKRIRLSDTSRTHVGSNQKEMLIEHVYSLLGLPPVTDLIGLSGVVL